MQRDRAADMMARAALCGRSAALAGRAETLHPAALAVEVEALRRAAAAEGLTAADRVCRAFTAALSGSRCRNGFSYWFAVLGDALGCEAADADQTADACLAAVMVRMA